MRDAPSKYEAAVALYKEGVTSPAVIAERIGAASAASVAVTPSKARARGDIPPHESRASKRGRPMWQIKVRLSTDAHTLLDAFAGDCGKTSAEAAADLLTDLLHEDAAAHARAQ